MPSNELYHHGIQGQKWGIRRYQNEDGTYTSEGKKRRNEGGVYGSAGNVKKRRNEDKVYDSAGKTKKNNSEEAQSGKISKKKAIAIAAVATVGTVAVILYLKKNPEAIVKGKKTIQSVLKNTETVKSLLKNTETVSHPDHLKLFDGKKANELSDHELKERISRLGLEKQYTKLVNNNDSSVAKELVRKMGSVSSAIATTYGFAANINKVKKTFESTLDKIESKKKDEEEEQTKRESI